MKKMMVALMLLSLAGVASAQYDDSFIGIAADDAYTVCYTDWAAGASVDTYYYVYIMPEIDGVSGAEFRNENLPIAEVPNVFTTENWLGLTIGDLGFGLSIALDTPQAGPFVLLGTVNYFILTDTGDVPADFLMTIGPTLDSENLIITDFDFVEYAVEGGQFTFNCSEPDLCVCYDTGIAVEGASWSSIKSLY